MASRKREGAGAPSFVYAVIAALLALVLLVGLDSGASRNHVVIRSVASAGPAALPPAG